MADPVDRWLAASAELPAALRAVSPADIVTWLVDHDWVEADGKRAWRAPDGSEIEVPMDGRPDQMQRVWETLHDIQRWLGAP